MATNFTAVSENTKRLLGKGQYDKAITALENFLPDATDNDAANALNTLGDIYLKKKNMVASIDHFLKASHAFEKAGFPLKAIATLKKIVKMDPDRTEVYIRLGDLNARRDMVGNAVEAYLKVVRLMSSQGNRDDALGMIKKVCILDPVNTRHRLQLAAELFELGFTDQAVEETLNAIDLFLQRGNLEEAERYCRHLLDLDPNSKGAQDRLERIATWGQETPAGGGDAGGGVAGEMSIDDLFAELDSAIDGNAPAAAPAAAAPGQPETGFSMGGDDAGSEGFSFGEAPAAASEPAEEAGFGELSFDDAPAPAAEPEADAGFGELSFDDTPAPAAEPEADAGFGELSLDGGDEPDAAGPGEISLEMDDTPAEATAPAAAPEPDTGFDASDLFAVSAGADTAPEPEPEPEAEAADAGMFALDMEDAAPAEAEEPADAMFALDTDDTAPADDFNAEEAFSEAKFYEAQGLKDDAITLYMKILDADPNHAGAQEAMAGMRTDAADVEDLFEMKSARMNTPEEAAPAKAAPQPEPSDEEIDSLFGASSTPESPATPEPVVAAPSADGGMDLSDEFSDLTSDIQDSLDEGTRDKNWRKVSEEAQFAEILSAFRTGIQQEVADDDSETHYDLGLAYREMGLVDEAISEFQLAVKGTQRFADACIALAQCFTEQGKTNLAVGQLEKASKRLNGTEDEWAAVVYELASALEMVGKVEEAKKHFEEVYAQDISYRDVANRLAALG